MIARGKPDHQKAKALRAMATITQQRLEKTEQEKYPSNTLTDYYDIIHKLMEARTFDAGVKIKGEGAHQQLIDYLAKEHLIDEGMRVFLQEMREQRNRIAYEGFSIPASYITQNRLRIKKIIERLQ
jgi:pentatricopeptide repeat protein